MVDIGDLRYDRTVSEEFLAHFIQAGFARALIDYARAPYPIDFQFRKDPKRPSHQWATLYVGLTAVLNVVDMGAKGLALLGAQDVPRSEEPAGMDGGLAGPCA